MTVKELHIAFYEGLNQIASFQGDEYLEEEVDRYLTRGQIALITELYKGYTQKQQYAREMSSIEVINKILPVYYPSVLENIYFSHTGYNFGYIIPPTNYMYPINIKPYVKYAKLCDVDYQEQINTKKEYIAVLPFNDKLIGDNDNLDFILSNNDVPLLSLSSYNLPTITEDAEKFYYIQVVLEEINRRNVTITNNNIAVNPINQYTLLDIEIYWENYRNLHYPNCFIIKSNTDYTGQYIELKIDSNSASSYTANNTITDYIIETEKARGLWYELEYNTKNIVGNSFENTVIAREIDKKKGMELLDNPLDKPTHTRPHSIHSNNYIWLHTPSRAVCTKVYLDYIRYPKPISLSLQWHAELDELLHQDLVNRAVQFAMVETGDMKIQNKLPMDNKDL